MYFLVSLIHDGFLLSVAVDTREVQPHDTGEKEQLGLANVKVEPGSTGATTTSSTGTRLLHGILSQHPQQHGLGLQNGYGRYLTGHAQMGQPSYTTAAIATTSTPGKAGVSLFLVFPESSRRRSVIVCLIASDHTTQLANNRHVKEKLKDMKKKFFFRAKSMRVRIFYTST